MSDHWKLDCLQIARMHNRSTDPVSVRSGGVGGWAGSLLGRFRKMVGGTWIARRSRPRTVGRPAVEGGARPPARAGAVAAAVAGEDPERLEQQRRMLPGGAAAAVRAALAERDAAAAVLHPPAPRAPVRQRVPAARAAQHGEPGGMRALPAEYHPRIADTGWVGTACVRRTADKVRETRPTRHDDAQRASACPPTQRAGKLSCGRI